MKTERSIAMCVILSVITCGLYGIYWFIVITDEVNAVTGNQKDLSGGMSFLLNLITCGLFSLYWGFNMGDKLDRYFGEHTSRGILYLILALFGFNIISLLLIQDSLNKA